MTDERRGPDPGTPQAKHGAKALLEKLGDGVSDHFRELGKKGGKTVLDQNGRNFYAKIGRKGGEVTKRIHGGAFYAEIGRKGGLKGKGIPKPGAGRKTTMPSITAPTGRSAHILIRR